MDIIRQVVVFDAADLQAESAFWAGMLDGHVVEDDRWHTVIDAADHWRVGCSWRQTMLRRSGRTGTRSRFT